MMEPNNADIEPEVVQGARVQSVSRAMAILVAVASSPRGLTAKEISLRLGLSRPTTYHLLRTLQSGSFLRRGTDGRMLLDYRIGTLSEGLERHFSPDGTLGGHVRRLAAETGELTYLTVRRGSEVIQLKSEEPRGHSLNAAPPPPGVLDFVHARASGKVAMAWAPPDVLDRFLVEHTFTRCTETTITSPEAFAAELELVRERGWATSIEEYNDGVSSVAAPLDGGASPFALALSASADRFESSFDTYLSTLLEIVQSAGPSPVPTSNA